MQNLNEWAKKIHENAVAHGWWEGDRDEADVIALIHSEWSEALEEDRAGRPMIYADDYEGSKRIERIEDFPDGAKPEGVAVELIDGVIRILDYFGYMGADARRLQFNNDSDISLPMLVCGLHVSTSNAYMHDDLSFLRNAISNVFSWIRERGYDPEEIMRIKHEFNVRRPYKHGKRY